jgi:hypothetical protein
LAEQIVLSVYLELAHKAPRLLSEDVALASWLRERTCKMAVNVLRAEDRAIDWAVVKREKKALPAPASVPPAPPGIAIHICQSIFWSDVRHKAHGFSLPRIWWPAWMRPLHVCGVAVCLLAMIVWWNNPFHHHNAIIRSQGVRMTPASFAQLAGPEEGKPALPSHTANTNSATTTAAR